jgi:D-lyxose ketol-isomerase
MKRSEINEFIADAVAFFDSHGYHLPPFAHWSPDDWQTKGPEADEIRRCRLGWDLTDFGSGDFLKVGLLLFTVRNGNHADPGNPKTYAEKAMIVREGQVTPWHFHGGKMEDIINRGGGNLVIDLCSTDEKGAQIDAEVTVSTDGVKRTVPAKGTVILTPGESITLTRGLSHQFYGEKGKGKVFVGEVSSVNDDETDNFFIPPIGRFPDIEEDQPPLHLLCTEYP